MEYLTMLRWLHNDISVSDRNDEFEITIPIEVNR